MQIKNGLLTVKNIVKHFDISGGLFDQLAIEKGRMFAGGQLLKP